MKVLILTNDNFDAWLWYLADEYKDHEFLIWHEGKYPWQHLKKDYDIGISFMYQHKVPAREVNTHTWFNFHPAPLPEYKGRNLCYHAVMNGEKEFGATIHYMDENFDTGNIIDVWKFDIEDWMTAEDVSFSAMGFSMSLFKEYLPRILAGEKFESVPNVGGRYYPKMPIGDTLVCLDGEYSFNLNRFVRAVSYKDFHPKLVVGGVKYKIVKE